MIKLFLFFGFIIIANHSFAQSDSSPASQIAERIAQKMKDSLELSNQQKTQLYSINMQIHEWKGNVRQQYSGTDSVGYYIQRMENRRDSLYRNVLNEEKYVIYKQKKRTLISNN